MQLQTTVGIGTFQKHFKSFWYIRFALGKWHPETSRRTTSDVAKARHVAIGRMSTCSAELGLPGNRCTGSAGGPHDVPYEAPYIKACGTVRETDACWSDESPSASYCDPCRQTIDVPAQACDLQHGTMAAAVIARHYKGP